MGNFAWGLMGGLKGLGEGINDNANQLRKEALIKLQGDQRMEQIGATGDARRSAVERAEGREDSQRAEDRVWAEEDRDLKAAAKAKKGGSGKAGKPGKVASGVYSRLKADERFQDSMGDPDMARINRHAQRIERYMNEGEGMSQAEAIQRADDEMIYEEEHKENSSYWDGKRETTEMRRNQEGRGRFTGDYGDDEPARAPTAKTPVGQPQPSATPEGLNPTGLPQPQSQAEWEALPAGTRFIDPQGKVRVK